MEQCRADINPFFYGKSEHEHNPTLYVPRSIPRWAGRKPILFEGVRGCGKSSALKLLSWEVAWKVSPIKVIGSTPAIGFLEKPKHIGLYYRVEDIDNPLWDRWQVNRANPDMAQRYFGTYLEFLYLDLFLDALIRIREKTRELFMDQSAEDQLTRQLLRECFPQTQPRVLNFSFVSLRELVGHVHRGIRHLVLQNTSGEKIARTYTTVGPGYLLKQAGNEFAKCYPKIADWIILILLDDCNFLSRWQTVVVNTAVANCKEPISYKLSTLAGMYPTLETLDEQRPAILDNIDVEALPSQTIYSAPTKEGAKKGRRGVNYVIFANQVCKARIDEHFGRELSGKFNFKELLGPFDLEQALKKKLESSENNEALELLNEAKKAKAQGQSFPITGTWLLSRKVREYEPALDKESGEDTFKRRTRQISSVYIKKWSHVAGVALCREFSLDFPYSGYGVVLHLSSGSIREMLSIMSMIWDEVGDEVEQFLRQRPIPQKIQTAGILNAAENKFSFIDSNVISESGTTLQGVCGRLGTLFSKCQSYPYILTTPETASIRISSKVVEGEIGDIVRKGVVSGWLLKRVARDVIDIGLHPILAPKFGISFRNPFYYPEPISDELLKVLFLGNDSEARKVEKLVLDQRMVRYKKRHNSTPVQLKLSLNK